MMTHYSVVEHLSMDKQFFLVEAHNRKSALYRLDLSAPNEADFVININQHSDHLDINKKSTVQDFFDYTDDYHKCSFISSSLPEVVARAQFYILRSLFALISCKFRELNFLLLDYPQVEISKFEEVLNNYAPELTQTAAFEDIKKSKIEVDASRPVGKLRIKSLFEFSLETNVRRIYLIRE